jgi:amino-acid N-acetyltransferase
MKNPVKFRYADQNDLNQILNLLRANNLPFADVDLAKIKFILAEATDILIGCIGIEHYSSNGLLRSFAVDENYRNLGIGNKLLQYLMSFSKQIGVHNLHLLTVTAEKYFLLKSFIVENRNHAPESIKRTSEFSTLCSSTSTYMTYYDINRAALIYQNNLHLTKFDEETQSKYWAISGENIMFTYFEVEPDKLFSEHIHESEQITYVLEGELYFEIGNSIYQIEKGESIVVPSNIPHKVWTAKQRAIAVDAWSKVNEKYL